MSTIYLDADYNCLHVKQRQRCRSTRVPFRRTLAKTFRHVQRADGHRSRAVRIQFRRAVGDRRSSSIWYRCPIHRSTSLDRTLQRILSDRRMVDFESGRSVRVRVFGH